MLPAGCPDLHLSADGAQLPLVFAPLKQVIVERLAQVLGCHAVVGKAGDDAAIGQEGSQRVAFLAIFLRRRQHMIGRREAAFKVIDQAVDQPVQDARALLPQLVAQIRVALILGDLDVERHQHDAPPDAVVAAADLGLVVPADRQLELRAHLDEIGMKGAHEDRFAAGQFLDQPLLQALAFVRLGCAHEPRPDQRHEIGGGIAAAPAIVACQAFDAGSRRVIPEQPRHEIDQHGFAVRPRAIEKRDLLVAGQRRHGQAEPALQEFPHFPVGLDAREELVEQRGPGVRRVFDRHDLGQQLVPAVAGKGDLGRPAEPLSAADAEFQHPGLRVDIQRARIQRLERHRQRDTGLDQGVVDPARVSGGLREPLVLLLLLFEPGLDPADLGEIRARLGHRRIIVGASVAGCLGLDLAQARLDVALPCKQVAFPFGQLQHGNFLQDQVGKLLRLGAHVQLVGILFPELPAPGKPPDTRDEHGILAEMKGEPLPVAEIVHRQTCRLAQRLGVIAASIRRAVVAGRIYACRRNILGRVESFPDFPDAIIHHAALSSL